MENWEVVGTLVIGFVGWLGLTTVQHTKKLAVMEKNSALTDAALNNIKESIQHLSQRFDLFLKNEIEVLKDFAKNR